VLRSPPEVKMLPHNQPMPKLRMLWMPQSRRETIEKKPDAAKPPNKADLHKKSDDGAKRGKADNKPAEKGAKSKPDDAEISAERGAKSKPDDAEKSVEQKPPDATSLITEMHDQLPCAKVV
jgi:hypothetical protein